MELKAYAKINWFLKIIGLREDGYHEIETLMQKIDLYDTITFSYADEIVVEDSTGIPMKENLVYKAAILLRDIYRVKRGVKISIEKKIPSGAGLGGGSSDAATTLSGLRDFWSINCKDEDLIEIASRIGSDVPFFLSGVLGYAYGRGEKVIPLNIGVEVNLLLVKPPVNVSTEWVYNKYRTQNREYKIQGNGEKVSKVMLTNREEKLNNIRYLTQLIRELRFEESSSYFFNDLESVTIKSFPVIAEIKDRLRQEGARLTLMSGSGPTVFGVFTSSGEALKAEAAFSDFWTTTVKTLTDN